VHIKIIQTGVFRFKKGFYKQKDIENEQSFRS